MNILVSDNWLRSFVKTRATSREIAKYLSLCGPSVEKVEKSGLDYVYSIEVTTNRIDSASVYGIAREASAILPRFGLATTLHSIKPSKLSLTSHVDYLEAKVDANLCPRFTAVLIKNVTIKESPNQVKERLESVGVRAINNVVDISNYIMHELGQPVHTFDYDKIKGAKMILRESRKGETLTTLDGKTHSLPGGDIVIEDGAERLIDLAGIMGGENSAVDEKTKNVLLFVQTYNPVNIRRTSMALAHRTEAAEIFEKGLDPELVLLGMQKALEMFVKLTGGRPAARVLDIYPSPYKPKKVSLPLEFIQKRLGMEIERGEVSKTLTPLGFGVGWSGKSLTVEVPSFRSRDVAIPEDIVEEVARIYGYQKLPSVLMEGAIPDPLPDSPFVFESKVKNILRGHGAVEVYTSSLVPKEFTEGEALRLRNALGKESEDLRTSLMPSLIEAVEANAGEKEPFHLFEMAKVYLPRRNDLPDEVMSLAGIFSNYTYRQAKGILESLLEELNCQAEMLAEDAKHFLPSQRLKITSKGLEVGVFGTLSRNGLIYYEFGVEKLRRASKDFGGYKPLPKYPAQIEDMTFSFPSRTKVGEVIDYVRFSSSRVAKMELTDIYKGAYTFRLWYQDPLKTLTDKEVGEIREKILLNLKKKFGATLKG